MSAPRVEHLASLGLASLAAALASGTARAQASGAAHEEGAVDLAWNAPADCPTREVFLAELARALGPAARGRVPSKTSVDITSSGAEGWTATVRIATEGLSSERVLHAENCQTLASAAAVIAAVAIEAPPGGPSPADARPIAPPEGSRDRPPLADTRSPRPSQPDIGAAAILDDGTMPSLSPGVEGKIGFTSRIASLRLRVEGSGALFEDQDAVAQGFPTKGGRFSLVTGGGRVCGTRVFGPLEAGPCLGGELDFMSGTGTGTTAEPGNGSWGAVNGSAFGAWSPTRGFGLTVRVDGVLPLALPPFVIKRDAGDIFVHQPFWVTFRAAVGIELRFF